MNIEIDSKVTEEGKTLTEVTETVEIPNDKVISKVSETSSVTEDGEFVTVTETVVLRVTPKHEQECFVDIEGKRVPWDKATISTEEIIKLGGWDSSQGVILIDKDNNERQLKPGECVEIKPGDCFAKKIRFKRG